MALPLASSTPSKKRKVRNLWYLEGPLAALLCAVPALVAQTPAMVTAPIDAGDRIELGNTVRLELKNAADLGRADSSKQLTSIMLSFSKTAVQEAALQQLLADLQNPASEEYHHWLTPEQFGERFGANPEDIAEVVEWLGGRGFSNIQIAHGRDFVTFDGNISTVESAFNVEIHNYTVKGEEHFANSTNVQIPAALRPIVNGVTGLHNFYLKPAGAHQLASPSPEFNNGTSGHFLAAEDIQTIYDIKPLYSASFTGSGVKLVILGEYPITANDASIAAYRKLNGLPPIDLRPQGKSYTPASPTVPTDIEAYLDIEVAGAVAKNATIIYVYDANASQAAITAIDNQLGDIVSMSYAGCEALDANSTFEGELQKAATEGITFVSGSGDAGATGMGDGETCDAPTQSAANHGLAVNYPASSVNVTAIGGTTLSEGSGSYWGAQDPNGGSALKYIPEKVWNDTPCGGTIDCATGGGVSTKFRKPNWQAGIGVPTDGYRDVPDLAFAASSNHDGYILCMANYCINSWASSTGTTFHTGGTSAATPVFAGIMALVDQKQGTGQGNVNPAIYALARTNYSTVFHDITTGTNSVACVKGSPNCPSGGTMGWAAHTGYDFATGWGSVDANQFVLAFSNIERSPVIASWSVSPTTLIPGGTVTIKYSATDPGGSGLVLADLMRAPDSNGQPGIWTVLKSQILGGVGPTPVTLTDTPATQGKYWYGTQLFNAIGNHIHEPSPTLATVSVQIPVIKGFTPTSLQAGSAGQKLTIGGTGFVSASTVTFNGKAHTATNGNTTSLSIMLTTADLATMGNFPVVVTNPAQGGGASAPMNFTVTAPNPAPTITGLSPSPLVVGSAAQKLAISGTGFLSTSTVKYNGVAHAATYGSATSLSISLTAADLAKAGSYPVVVTNPAPGGGASSPASFTVLSKYQVPTIIGFTPGFLPPGSVAQTLVINGTGFFSTSTVKYNGTAHTGAYLSASSMSIVLTKADLAKAGSYPVVVANPAPGGGASTPAAFTVGVANPVPTITTLSPPSLQAGAAPRTLAINGTGFLPSSTATFNAVGHAATFVSASQLTIALTSGDLSVAGINLVVVTNPAPGGGASAPASFNVNVPPTAWVLTVSSTNPLSGVPITASPADNYGLSSGATSFTLTYNQNTQVALTAPATAGGNAFSSWTGCDSVPGNICIVNLTASRAVTANYAQVITQTAHFNYALAPLRSGFEYVLGVALDGNSNVFVADLMGNAVYEILAAGDYAQVKKLGGFSNPIGVATDANENLFIAIDKGRSDGEVDEILAAGDYTRIVTVGGGLASPEGVAVDAKGNIFVGDDNNGSPEVKEVPLGCASSACTLTLASGFGYPSAISLDSSGNVFVADGVNASVYEIQTAGGSNVVRTIGSGFVYPRGVALDGSGNVIVADRSGIYGTLKKVVAAGDYKTVETLADNVACDKSVVIGGDGKLFCAFGGTVSELETGTVDFGTTLVGQSSAIFPLTFTFDKNATLGSFAVLNGGSELDIAAASGSTCSADTAYTAGSTCTVNVTFTPQSAGIHSGTVVLLDGLGITIATANLQGKGTSVSGDTETISK